ncbi:hypothetical protein MVEN_00733800 [Mycena venus]|uniref:DUF5648 domain-containing protein n=1 Tax=Mycena venus TaxID=2733690 RepID=A0A8H7D5G8_9AGAR|nr:hypothetical protein MVEN_00733800 [Mycena venus]
MISFAYFYLALGLFAGEVRAACAGASQAQPLYRDWNPTISDHFYTPDFAEASGAVASGWTQEGVRALIFTTQVAGSVRFLRLWNEAAGDHFYTINATEAQGAVNGGYVFEDQNPMYIYPMQLCGSVPIYRLFSGDTGDHFYTVDASERDGAESSGWKFEWIAGYAFPPPKDATSGSPPAPAPPKSTTTTNSPTTNSPITNSPITNSPTPPPASKTTASSVAPSSAAVSTTPTDLPYGMGTTDPVDVLPAPTSSLGTSLGDTAPSTTPGTGTGTRLCLAPVSYLAASLVLVLRCWL